MVNRKYRVCVAGLPPKEVDTPEEAIRTASKYCPLFTLRDKDSCLRDLTTGRHVHLNARLRIEVIDEETKSYEQQELDSLGVNDDPIIRVQLSYNSKATKHLNITKEQFDAISKIIVEGKSSG